MPKTLLLALIATAAATPPKPVVAQAAPTCLNTGSPALETTGQCRQIGASHAGAPPAQR